MENLKINAKTVMEVHYVFIKDKKQYAKRGHVKELLFVNMVAEK
jgi:hypothetical protein